MAAVEVEELVVAYGDTVAVNQLSFAADDGEVTVVLGPNGAGKTSTLECLEGFRTPTAGAVRVCGLDPVRQRNQLNRRIGVMLQNGGVYTGIRVAEVMSLFAAYYEEPADPDELLTLVGLDHRRRSTWRSLSGGEQQRLSLALALVGRPEVAFLDEPTAGVDLSGKQLIRSVIEGLRHDGVAVVLTTHDLDEAETLADRIVIIDQGRVVADGTPDELLTSTDAGSVEFRARPSLPLSELARAVGAPVEEQAAGEYRVLAPPDPELVARLTAALAARGELIGDLRAGRRRLDELFLRLTGEDTVAGPRVRSGRGRAAR